MVDVRENKIRAADFGPPPVVLKVWNYYAERSISAGTNRALVLEDAIAIGIGAGVVVSVQQGVQVFGHRFQNGG